MYYQKEVKQTGNTRSYYKAVNLLKTKYAPVVWGISSLFPGETDVQIDEQVAEFFNRISKEFDPIPDPVCTMDVASPPIKPYKLSVRLRTFRKPQSQVTGDIYPQLVSKAASCSSDHTRRDFWVGTDAVRAWRGAKISARAGMNLW